MSSYSCGIFAWEQDCMNRPMFSYKSICSASDGLHSPQADPFSQFLGLRSASSSTRNASCSGS
eukprot:3629128-Prorocentrum_lima.AAC.1